MQLWRFLLTSFLAGVFAESNLQKGSRRSSFGTRVDRQNVVAFDKDSVLIRGERMMLFSGEVHPFRLPVPGLWLDVFQKIKAMGFNTVSFYVDWGLVGGTPGAVRLDGIFSLDTFFEAASSAGIYLIARPGPYINAETAAGGFPGWTLRINCTLRSTCPEYLNATEKYMATVGKAIAAAQITSGGPVVLVQPENEYSSWPGLTSGLERYQNHTFPSEMNKRYMAFVEQQLRDAGIVVPLINNDNYVMGNNAPDTGVGAVDIYAIDAYPLRYDCANPTIWPSDRFPRDWNTVHQIESPSTPFAIAEFQGGSGTPFGGVNQDACNALINEEAVRVIYKNNYSFGLKLFNIYMTFGGTNWGSLGYMGGDTSYDYGAAITEDRHVWREKYSEQKLQAHFFKVSPAFLTAAPGNGTNGTYVSSSDVAVTPLWGSGQSGTNFYVVRQANFSSVANVQYKLLATTSRGNVSVPQLGGQLSLLGRDSKIHVTDYDVGGIHLIYSTAEIFTLASDDFGQHNLLLYGGEGELHEFALPAELGPPETSDGGKIQVRQFGHANVVQWNVTRERQVVLLPGRRLTIYLLWRNSAYDYWPLELAAEQPIGNFSSPSKSSVIVKAGYLLRSASISRQTLKLSGDVNTTTEIEIICEPTQQVKSIELNGLRLDTTRNRLGNVVATATFSPPVFDSNDLLNQTWRSINSLVETHSTYDDSCWTSCNQTTSTNNQRNLSTPNSLYASDYGYHTGSLIYRAHFTAKSVPSSPTLFLNVSGGYAFGHSVFLNETFLGSFIGTGGPQIFAQNFSMPILKSEKQYVLTILIDHMGQTEEGPGSDAIKYPMGILDFRLSGYDAKELAWKMTGNLGGEQYQDLVRGPRNEGALFAERHGFHQPNPPSANWTIDSPASGLSGPGVIFYSTSFDLQVPSGYDVPMSFVFNKRVLPRNESAYRIQLFVNGYQFGKYISNLGPQTDFPVPEGILNYNGTNYVGLTLWALEVGGARLTGFELVPQMPVWSGYEKPELAPQPAWKPRIRAY